MAMAPNEMMGGGSPQTAPQGAGGQGLLSGAMGQGGNPQGGDQQGMSQPDIDSLKKAKQLAMSMIYDERIFGELIKRFDAGDKTDTLAQTVVAIVSRVSERLGGMSLASILGLAIALIGEVAQMISDTGREAYTASDTERALYMAVQLWLQQNKDKVNPQELQAGMQALQQTVGG